MLVIELWLLACDCQALWTVYCEIVRLSWFNAVCSLDTSIRMKWLLYSSLVFCWVLCCLIGFLLSIVLFDNHSLLICLCKFQSLIRVIAILKTDKKRRSPSPFLAKSDENKTHLCPSIFGSTLFQKRRTTSLKSDGLRHVLILFF